MQGIWRSPGASTRSRFTSATLLKIAVSRRCRWPAAAFFTDPRSAHRPQQTKRVRQAVQGRLETFARVAEPGDVGERPIDKRGGLGQVVGAVFEPIQHGGAVD